jgi:hypothetical protein
MLGMLCDFFQSLYLASALIKFIWTSGGTYSQITSEAPFLGLGKTSMIGLKGRHREMSSSENSVSMEATNSEDEQVFGPLLESDRC